jgi:hypothetical protein
MATNDYINMNGIISNSTYGVLDRNDTSTFTVNGAYIGSTTIDNSAISSYKIIPKYSTVTVDWHPSTFTSTLTNEEMLKIISEKMQDDFLKPIVNTEKFSVEIIPDKPSDIRKEDDPQLELF